MALRAVERQAATQPLGCGECRPEKDSVSTADQIIDSPHFFSGMNLKMKYIAPITLFAVLLIALYGTDKATLSPEDAARVVQRTKSV